MGAISIEAIEAEILKMDEKVTEADLRLAALLIASAACGTDDEATLVRETGYPSEFIKTAGSNLREYGVWPNIGAAAKHWQGEGGGISLWLDVSVAKGEMARKLNPDGEPAYWMTPQGEREIEARLNRKRG